MKNDPFMGVVRNEPHVESSDLSWSCETDESIPLPCTVFSENEISDLLDFADEEDLHFLQYGVLSSISDQEPYEATHQEDSHQTVKEGEQRADFDFHYFLTDAALHTVRQNCEDDKQNGNIMMRSIE